MRTLNALGVTCGIGSMLIGARKAGFKIHGNIEWRKYYHYRDEDGKNTFEENFKKARLVKTIDEFASSPKDIDLVMGHPECGNFSNLRINKTNALNDPTDIPLFIDLVAKIKPRFFVQDNLPKSLIAVPIKDWHAKLPEYDLFPEWISNYNYGNIQKFRNRFFMIGALKKEKFVFKPGEIENTTTVREHLAGCENFPNHYKHNLKTHTGRTCGLHEAAENCAWRELKNYFSDKPQGAIMRYNARDGERKTRIGLCKTYLDKHSHVLTGTNPIIHPTTNLPFSIRERLRIQGAPDNFVVFSEKLEGDRWNHDRNSNLIKQTGKFMPVQFSTYIAKQIAAHLKGKNFRCSDKRMIKPNAFIDEAKQWYCNNVGYKGNKDKVCNNCWLPCG